MRHGKKALLTAGEQKELFALLLSVQQGASTHEIWFALFDADGSARDRAAGFLAAVAFGAASVPDAGARRKARALLGNWYVAKSGADKAGESGDIGRSDGAADGGASTA